MRDDLDLNVKDALPMICGHCGTHVGATVVAYVEGTPYERRRYVGTPFIPNVAWVRCPVCKSGSVLNEQILVPAVPTGPNITGLPSDVDAAYDEARRAHGASAFVACELVCRKILMHVAVDKGAAAGKPFASYVEHLKHEGYISPAMVRWVDMIRKNANEATHELAEVTEERAKSTLIFTAELLRVTYEMEALADQFGPGAQGSS